MNSQLNILNPGRERRIPKHFSWLDQRLVRENRLRGLSSDAVSLYLFLNCVADCRGMSFYSASGISSRLCLSSLQDARTELIQADLVLYQAPYYQVLSLPPLAPPPQLEPQVKEQKPGATREEVAAVYAAFLEGDKQ